MALTRPAPGGLPIVQVTCVVDSETGETISRAWASCVGQAAVDVRASALVALGLQHTLTQQTRVLVRANSIG